MSSSASSSPKVNLLDLAAACLACTEQASKAIQNIARPLPPPPHPPLQQQTTDSTSSTDTQNGKLPTTVQKNTRFKEDGSFVTDADFVAQGVIVQAIQSVSKHVRIVGEESAEEMAEHIGKHDPYLDPHVLQRTQHEIRWRYHQIVLADETVVDDSMRTTTTKTEPIRPPLAQGIVPSEPIDTRIIDVLKDKNDPEDVIVDADRVGIIVDPLDGTKSYALGEYDAVSILISIILDNQPCFGVITKPFGYLPEANLTTMLDTSCVAIYGGPLVKGAYIAGGKTLQATPIGNASTAAEELPRAVISTSRSKGIVNEFCVHLGEQGLIHKEPLLISGAGEKSLRLILQINNEALWFFPKSGTSLWDVAAPDAILRSLGGKLTDKFGNDMDYSKPRKDAENTEGVVACIDQELHAKCIALFREGNWVDHR
jgi:3'-phosphoadenosine 5'-phosphosulfate (PAPS) 3'-phosphatase